MVLLGIGKNGIGCFLDLGFSKTIPTAAITRMRIENNPIWARGIPNAADCEDCFSAFAAKMYVADSASSAALNVSVISANPSVLGVTSNLIVFDSPTSKSTIPSPITSISQS